MQPSSVMDFHESITYQNLCSVGLTGPVSQLRTWSVKETWRYCVGFKARWSQTLEVSISFLNA